MGITFKQLHDVLKKILKAIEEDRGHGVVIGARSGVSSLLEPLRELIQNTDGLEGLSTATNSLLTTIRDNADGIEGLITAGNALLTTIRDNASGLDGLLTSIRDNADEVEGKQDTGNTSLSSIDTDTTSIDTGIGDLNTKFGLLGSIGALILTIQITIVVITAQLEIGGENVADLLDIIRNLLTTIDADTSAMNPNIAGINSFTASTRDNLDRDYGLRVWEFSETYTCTVAGSFFGVWQVPATSTLSRLQFGTQANPLGGAANYQVLALDRGTGLTALPLGFITFQAFISNRLNVGDPQLIFGPLNDIQVGPRALARTFLLTESFTFIIRAAMSGAAAPPAIPVITGGSGTFTRVLNFNRVTNLDP